MPAPQAERFKRGDPLEHTSKGGLALPLPTSPLAEPGEERALVFDAPVRGSAKPPKHWFDLEPAARATAVAALGLPAYRARQVATHVFGRYEYRPEEWTDLPTDARAQLAVLFPSLLTPLQELTADRGLTVKTAWALTGGAVIESVLMRYPGRTTVCISSQAGCGMACPFCATGQGGLQRSLSTAEIVAQVADAETKLATGVVAGGPGQVNNVVFMGMGEPLANYVAVMAALRQLVRPKPDGFGISARGLTVSTVGLVPGIARLAAEELPITLAVSLHAPDDELRDELIPVNQRWKVGELLDAAWDYARITKRRVSIEYALIRDINDQAVRADLLARELRRRGDWNWAHVNLIPLNPTPGSKWTASRRRDQQTFIERLERAGVPVTLRDTRGREIDGACGQLAASLA
ncbi:MAG: 23S rRNA (adenine(2503)-C(2))-methyltransferase RlmN [Propionibacteriaceae bacterium]|jgi:23S rRNA (adenine2503-C2)-methyltransferase|nr:23S rRNA (adenine(2503)-C(2))-methyltransferase RlmN [Propionibacteriaceae bacterium]